jgi:hypothetical protein
MSKQTVLPKKRKLDDLLPAPEECENFKPYYSFVSLSSKKLRANIRTDGRTYIHIHTYDTVQGESSIFSSLGTNADSEVGCLQMD